MNFRTTETSSTDWSGDCLVIGLFEDAMEMTGDLAALDQRLSGTLTELIAETEFKGQAGNSAITRVGSNSPVRKVGLVGLGATADYQGETLRQGAAAAARLAKREKCKTLGLAFPKLEAGDGASVQTMTEGVSLALHQDQRFKSETNGDAFTLEQIEILATPPQEEAIDHAQKICAGVILARELVAAPPNVVTPMALADTAADIAAESGMELEVLEQEACEALGMGSFLGEAQASDMPPKFIHLTYKPKGTPRRKLAIVGKGLTFDSGGLNLKVGGSGIEMMKTDMGGAAATFGAAKAIGLLQPDVEVHFISAATENMISGHAIHPGDILTASNGKTIEVNNTDAEGRLTLADALVFAEKLEVDAIVDLATLTGACIVALGEEMAGLWSPDTTLAAELETAAKTAGESLWQMPMESKYFDGLKSIVADMKNAGPRAGGSITAALFLQQFIQETAWAHLDVAGPVWTEKEQGYNNPGGTGYGVRTLVHWVLA